MTLTPTFTPDLDIDPVTQVMMEEGLIKTCAACKTTKHHTQFYKVPRPYCKRCSASMWYYHIAPTTRAARIKHAAYIWANWSAWMADKVVPSWLFAYKPMKRVTHISAEKVIGNLRVPYGEYEACKAASKRHNIPFLLTESEYEALQP